MSNSSRLDSLDGCLPGMRDCCVILHWGPTIFNHTVFISICWPLLIMSPARPPLHGCLPGRSICGMAWMVLWETRPRHLEPGAGRMRWGPSSAGKCRTSQSIASMHGLDIFRVLALTGRKVSPEVLVFGVEPSYLGWSMELSPQIKSAMPFLIEAVQQEIGVGIKGRPMEEGRPLRSEAG